MPVHFAKSHTHVKKVEKPQDFFLAFIDELEKLFIKKLLEGTNKEKCKNFNIYNVIFLKKDK